MTRAPWWHTPLARYPPPAVRPGGHVCWCHPPGEVHTGDQFRPGWFRHDHEEGPVEWYAGTAELPLGLGVRP